VRTYAVRYFALQSKLSNEPKPPVAPNALVRIEISVASAPAVVGCVPMPNGVVL
jgi:hypothetical protein